MPTPAEVPMGSPAAALAPDGRGPPRAPVADGAHDPHRHHDLPIQAPGEEAEGGRARGAGDRRREKPPPYLGGSGGGRGSGAARHHDSGAARSIKHTARGDTRRIADQRRPEAGDRHRTKTSGRPRFFRRARSDAGRAPAAR